MVRTEVPIASKGEQMYITRQSGNAKGLSLAGSGWQAEETAKRNSCGEPNCYTSHCATSVVRCTLPRIWVVTNCKFGENDEHTNT